MYKSLIKPLLFRFSPENIHYKVMGFLKFFVPLPGGANLLHALYRVRDKRLEREVFGIRFPNPVGLAAGFDKDARWFDELSHLGFGFVEIGTVTPMPQPGNEKPRLFRVAKDEGLINRMGFNNGGAEAAAARLQYRRTNIIVGGNIGKNKVTPNEQALSDYEKAFDALYELVDYFVVNVSSPNTPNLRDLQDKEPLTRILSALKQRNQAKGQPKPILLKIAPDLTDGQLDDIVAIVADTGIEGVIATNTTISRANLQTSNGELEAIGNGGLSGKPLTNRSTEVIRYLHTKSGGAFPIIGVGGIHSAADALEKLDAGATLVQLYTGFIYEGPGLIKDINKAILAREQRTA